jgi:pyruvate dehydrogenase E1 component
VVILAKTKKGYGMGPVAQGRMTTHQQKKMDADDLRGFAQRFRLPLTDDDIAQQRFFRPGAESPEAKYLHERRAALGGYVPQRSSACPPLPPPPIESWGGFALEGGHKEMSTTMAFVRMLSGLQRDGTLGPRLVPIVADEARTFGMASLFRQVGIYAPDGQNYEPEDAGSMLAYREARDGQILEEGITEAGAMASWTAAATSYSTHGLPLLPFYIYYSIFGFQRVGDLIWAAADQRARGFLLGATSGRTTLGGEGLQHQDGSSHLVAATVPNCRAWDPAYAGELAILLQHGMQRMLVDQVDEFHYLTVMNENHAQAPVPASDAEHIVRGMRRLALAPLVKKPKARCVLAASGAILHEALAARELLATDFGVEATVFSVTSWSELARDHAAWERRRLFGAEGDVLPHATALLAQTEGPILAASDYVRAVAESIRPAVPAGRRFTTLGTDGFGRSDSRAALRRFFEVDRRAIAARALHALAEDGAFPAKDLRAAVMKLGIRDAGAAWTR